MRGISRVVEACFNRLTRMSNVEPFANEDEWSFSFLSFCTPISKMGSLSLPQIGAELNLLLLYLRFQIRFIVLFSAYLKRTEIFRS